MIECNQWLFMQVVYTVTYRCQASGHDASGGGVLGSGGLMRGGVFKGVWLDVKTTKDCL